MNRGLRAGPAFLANIEVAMRRFMVRSFLAVGQGSSNFIIHSNFVYYRDSEQFLQRFCILHEFVNKILECFSRFWGFVCIIAAENILKPIRPIARKIENFSTNCVLPTIFSIFFKLKKTINARYSKITTKFQGFAK